MAFWSRLFTRKPEQKSGTLDLFREIYGGMQSRSGVSVTASKALEVTTVLRCVQVLADGVATVPIKIFKDDGVTRTQAADHPLTRLLGVAPNKWQTSLEFRETVVFHLALTGNAFVYVGRLGNQVAELIPIEPGRVRYKQKPDGEMIYEVKGTGSNQEFQTFPASAIWHIRLASWNAWAGLDTVKLARDAIGLSMALEESHSALHSNGIQLGGLYTVDGTLTEEHYAKLTAWIANERQGLDNAFKPMILDRGAKFTPQTMTGVDAQHLETRKHQIEEICRAFGVNPIMVFHSDKVATYASAEQMFLSHAVHTIRPWHRRFEASIRANLLTEQDRRNGVYAKFIDTELLRANANDRANYYKAALGAGNAPAWLTQNEVRAFEELEPMPGGDELLRPAMSAPGPQGG